MIRLVHTVIFWVLSACVAYALFSGLADRIFPICGTLYGLALLLIAWRTLP